MAQQIRHAMQASSRPSKFWPALDASRPADADLTAIRQTMAAAVRDYECKCGETTSFTTDSTIEDYAALNRWLGFHDRCGEPADPEVRQSYANAMGIVKGLTR